MVIGGHKVEYKVGTKDFRMHKIVIAHDETVTWPFIFTKIK
jgi:hypothetical protein